MSVSYSFGPSKASLPHQQLPTFKAQSMTFGENQILRTTSTCPSMAEQTPLKARESLEHKVATRPQSMPLPSYPGGKPLKDKTKLSDLNNQTAVISVNQSVAMVSCWRNVHGTSPVDEGNNAVDGKVSPEVCAALVQRSLSTISQRERSSTCPEFYRSQSVKVQNAIKGSPRFERRSLMIKDDEISSLLDGLKDARKTDSCTKADINGREKQSLFRMRSNPIPRQKRDMQVDIKRNSMPQTRRNTCSMLEKIVLSDPVETEQQVPELFQCIRGATQRDLLEESDKMEPEPPKATYEVMYVGKARVKNKRVLSRHIDDLVAQLEAREAGLNKTTQGSDRRRHKSDSSIKSLPTSLDETLVKENELQKISHKAASFVGTELHNDSHAGSNDDMMEKHDSTDHLSEEHSSSETLINFGSHLSSSGSQLGPVQVTALHHHPEGHLTDLQSGGSTEGQGHSCHGNHTRVKTSTMLFRIGQQDISLISLDNKRTIIERKFKLISSVSQGSIKSDVFGFISRETGNQLICHLLRCCSSEIADEIMQQLQASFHNAFQMRQQHVQQICINCPLQQFHKLCQEVNGLCPETSYKLLCSRIEQLPEKEATELYQALQHQNPQCFEESVEVLMIALRKMCENKQREHSHISDVGKASQKCDIFLVDMKGRSNSKSNAFDFLTKKARKKLTASFENLMTNVQHKRDEVREAFRHRSATTDSEGGSFSKSVDDTYNTPDPSPAPSPAVANPDEVKFDFPSPPPSPTTGVRPRSSTVGAMPDSRVLGSITARQEERQKAELKEQEKRRASESPMKHMFILANASSPNRRTSGHMTTDDEDSSHLASNDSLSPLQRGSWRQAIFNRVVTPSRNPKTPTLEECLEEGRESSHVCTKSREEIRALWRKAILETLLLIRMEKENIDLRARQDEAHLKRQKLDYVEITPCLKEVSRLWDEMLTFPDRTKVKVDQDKLLNCVKMGVPQSKRGEIWCFLVEQHRLHHPITEDKTPKLRYSDLLKQLTTHQHAILIDLGRTFPGHPYFSMQLGTGQLALFNLLKAYSLMDQDVGYCQGLSFVAGILLMHMEETIAFEVWKHVMYNLGLRKQYRPNMIALQIQLYQLTRLIHDNYKDLYDHFEEHEIAPTLYAAPWFLTLFASQFPLGFVARVFDLIFIQGIDVIFKVALVLLGNHKELILQCNSFETIVEFIKTTLPEMGMIQMERVINQVFGMDIGKQLQSYEVEYHVLKEEMMYSPNKGDKDLLNKLEATNRSLRQQNMELIEKLQNAHSHERSLESLIHKYQTQETKLKSHIRTLELERSALLNAVSKLKQYIPAADQLSLDITLPTLTPSMPVSPVHHGSMGVTDRGVIGAHKDKVATLADTESQSKTVVQTGSS